MNPNLSMSSSKSRGELAAIFARLPAKNQPAPSLASGRCCDAPSGYPTLEALRNHTPADRIGLAPLAAPDDSRERMNYLRNDVRVTSHLHIADGLE